MTSRFGALLIDINGTVIQGHVAVDGAAQAVRSLRDGGYVLRFLTNTESKTAAATQERLAACGVDVEVDEIFTPVVAARMLLERTPGARPLLMMSDPVKEGLPRGSDGGVYTHVVVGDCQEVLDYRLLDEAFRAVRGGAELIVLQGGRFFRSADGEHIDTGAIAAAIEHATGKEGRLLGKPSRAYFELAAISAGVRPCEAAVIGDDATSDIGGGRTIGATTIHVRTGKFAEQISSADSADATFTVDSIAAVPRLLALLASGAGRVPA